MLAPFETKQLNEGIHLTTAERIVEEQKLLDSIAEECANKISQSFQLDSQFSAMTNAEIYHSGKKDIASKSKEILMKMLSEGYENDNAKSYEDNIESFTHKVTQRIISALIGCSRYVMSRSVVCIDCIYASVKDAAKNWFLPPEEVKELLQKGYWDNTGTSHCAK